MTGLTTKKTEKEQGGEFRNLDASESIEVTVQPKENLGANTFSVQIKIDNRESGVSIVRTSPREFAFQETAPKAK